MRVFAHDGSKVLEKSRPRGGYWQAETVLPIGMGTSLIKPNFCVLSWPQCVDNVVSSDVHLFSMSSDRPEDPILYDYLVEGATGGGFPLLGNV